MTDEAQPLEIICLNSGIQLYAKGLVDGQKKTYDACLRQTSQEYKNWIQARKNIIEWTAASYVYWRRHREYDQERATREALIDSYAYMTALLNDEPLRTRPMTEDWWEQRL